jgi:hypothetical protein
MFASLSNFEFHIPAGLAEPGTRYWRAVELSLNASWFVATLRSTDEELGFRRTMLVSWDTDLIHIVENMIGGYLEALLFMIPPWRSAGGQWRAHRIEQIWRAYDSDRSDEPLLVFTTSDGEQILGQLGEPPSGTVHGHELLVAVGKSPAGDADSRRDANLSAQEASGPGSI